MSKTKSNDPVDAFDIGFDEGPPASTGMTKREYFASEAMKGLLSGGDMPARTTDEGVASMAVDFADTLIKELNKDESH